MRRVKHIWECSLCCIPPPGGRGGVAIHKGVRTRHEAAPLYLRGTGAKGVRQSEQTLFPDTP